MSKNRLFITGALLLALCLYGCGETAAPVAAPAPTPTPAPVVTETPSPQPTPEPTPEPVSVFGQSYAPDAEAIAVQMPISSFDTLDDALQKLPALREIDIQFNEGWTDHLFDWAQLLQWEAAHPALTVRCRFPDGAAPDTVIALSLPADAPTDAETWNMLLSQLPALERVELTLLSDGREAAAMLLALRPELTVLWNDAYFGASDSSAVELTITEAPLQEITGWLACHPHVSDLDCYACPLTAEEAAALKNAFPAVRLHRNVTLNGKVYDSMTPMLDLHDAKIADTEAFSDELGAFETLERIELDGCNLTNPQLGLLQSRYPNTKVVWTVRFHKWRCRTDAIAFSTMQDGNNNNRQDANDVSVLQYCTDLIVLDLGHNQIADISWIKHLTKLQVLILADNRRLKDITPLQNCTQLKYVELFMNPISDISTLGELPELLDVNLCITHTADLSPLQNCKKLERIWIGKQTQDYCSKESLDALLAAFPNAQYDLTSVSSTNLGWRDHPRFSAFRSMLKTNVPEEPFLPE